MQTELKDGSQMLLSLLPGAPDSKSLYEAWDPPGSKPEGMVQKGLRDQESLCLGWVRTSSGASSGLIIHTAYLFYSSCEACKLS